MTSWLCASDAAGVCLPFFPQKIQEEIAIESKATEAVFVTVTETGQVISD